MFRGEIPPKPYFFAGIGNLKPNFRNLKSQYLQKYKSDRHKILNIPSGHQVDFVGGLKIQSNKIQDGGGRHLENGYCHQVWHGGRHGQSAACRDVNFDLQQNPRWRTAAILKKRKMSIFEISSPNLVCWWPLRARNVHVCHFWATTKSKMAAGRHLEKRKIAITRPPFEILSPNLARW